MFFKLQTTDKKTAARAGEISTGHGKILTPVFMPVGTVGAVKAVSHHQLETEIGAQIILGNTYHLFCRPGMEVMEEAGGLHRFSNWTKPLLTDSGGYQVFSLADKVKITEEGAKFQSHVDGSRHLFTPENVMDTQRIIGADIMMAFDECIAFPSEHKAAKKSMELTHRWLLRCTEQFKNTLPKYEHEQFLFPIVQGSVFPDLRKTSAEFIAEQNCEGNAIGGLSVGEPAEDLYAMTQLVCSILPKDKPRYLMGVGTPENLIECIARGVDMFDCVMPTRNGRNGMLYTRHGEINIKNKKWEKDFSPIDELSDCEFSRRYSKAYLRHLLNANEYLGGMIASVQNLTFYQWLMREARAQILAGNFAKWKEEIIPAISRRL